MGDGGERRAPGHARRELLTVLYADTSALMRAYVAAEPGHQELERLLLRGDDDVMTSALSRVELGSAMTRARHERRLRRWRNVLERFDADCLEEGPITLLVL